MNKKFIDPNIKNKSKTVEDRLQFIKYENKDLPLPTEIEISESGTCNRKCSFCPRSAPEFIDKKEFISNELHAKMCEELKSLNYKGTIRYSGFVEPLLDKNIYNLINMARKKLPDCNIEMVTNGDVLNAKRLKELFSEAKKKIISVISFIFAALFIGIKLILLFKFLFLIFLWIFVFTNPTRKTLLKRLYCVSFFINDGLNSNRCLERE